MATGIYFCNGEWNLSMFLFCGRPLNRLLLLFHQSKLQKKMSNLVLVAEVPSRDLDEGHSEVEQGSEEQRPLLKNEDKGCTSSSSSSSEVTTNYSLIPDASLPAQVRQVVIQHILVAWINKSRANLEPCCKTQVIDALAKSEVPIMAMQFACLNQTPHLLQHSTETPRCRKMAA